MDRQELLDLITTDDVITILKDLGSDTYKTDKNSDNTLQFTTVCHSGDSHKLYYYKDTKFFVCYTSCGSMSLYDLIMSAKGITFKESYEYLCKYKNVSFGKKLRKGLQTTKIDNKDLDFLKIHLYTRTKNNIKLPFYSKSILNIFDDYLPVSWHEEGVSDEVAEYFNIGFYISQNKCIIPHYDIYGNLVGIRARSFSQEDLDKGKKYMPITIQNLTYRYPINYNLYGLYQNKENIKQMKKAILFEGEKSVLQYSSIYGQENSIALASCGMNFSLYQRDLLLDLDIEEIIICYDKQYKLESINDENIDKNSKDWKEYENYIKRLIKISGMFTDYCNVSIVCSWDDRLSYKDSPLDKGKDTFEGLYRERYFVENIEELIEMIK